MKYKKSVVIAVAGLLIGCGVGICESRNRIWGEDDFFKRNDYGEGTYTEEMEVEIEGEEKPEKIEIEVEEKAYSDGEAEKVIQKVTEQLDTLILGKNTSFQEIRSPLYLPQQVEGSPAVLSWMTDNPQVLDWEGNLGKEIPEEGADVTLQGELSLGEVKRLYERQVKVYPETLTGGLLLRRKILEEMEEMNQVKDTDSFYLPQQAQGRAVRWRRTASHTGLFITVLSFLSAVLAAAGQEEKRQRREKDRRERLLRDYPDIVGKLVLFLGAGMTIKSAFSRIAADYQKFGEKENRPAYEEMALTCREMDGGIPEAEAYQRFGGRCGLPCYRTLSTLLLQNLKKGSRGLLELLEQEAAKAEEDRVRKARTKGEQVSSKLLVPMFLMLLIVLVILMVPAYLTFY